MMQTDTTDIRSQLNQSDDPALRRLAAALTDEQIEIIAAAFRDATG